MEKKNVKVLITGDFVISKSYNISKINSKVKTLFEASDINIVNLEAPVTNNNSKIVKTGPHLKSDLDSTTNVIKELEIGVATLANNHIMDYDEKGVIDTLKFCKEQNLTTVGAGINLEEASKTTYLDTVQGKIGLVNFAENEWASAAIDRAGANPLDIIDNINQIKDAKKNADYVIVLFHGGLEYYNLPSPWIQRLYRFYADQGADIVVGHHTHCINGYENYNGVPLYYSLGNFLFTKDNIHSDWYTGLILEINISKGKLKTECHPIHQDKTDFQLSFLEGSEKEKLLNRFKEYSEIIQNPLRLKDAWNSLILTKSNSYLNYWSPLIFIKNRYIKAFFIKTGIRFINKKGMAYYLNLMRCETHFNISKTIIENYLRK